MLDSIIHFSKHEKVNSSHAVITILVSSSSVAIIMTDLILKEKSNYNFPDAFIGAISFQSNICQNLYNKKVCINFEKVSSSVLPNGSIDIKIFLMLIENVSQSTKYKLMKCINQAIQNRKKRLLNFY